MKGDCEVGRQWYLLLKMIFKKYGCHQCHFDLSLYFYHKGPNMIIVNTCRDDFLCANSDKALFVDLQHHMQQFVEITTPHKKVQS